MEIEELIEAIKEANENNDIEGLVKLTDELGNKYIDNGFKYMQQLDFASGVASFKEANKVDNHYYEQCKQIYDSADKENGSWENVEKLLKRIKGDIAISQAYIHFSTGQFNATNRNPGKAIKSFKDAKNVFNTIYKDTDDGKYKYLSKYADALSVISSVTEETLKANFNTSSQKYQQAKNLMQNIFENVIPECFDINKVPPSEIEIYKSAIKMDMLSCEMQYYLSDFRDQFGKGNFAGSKEQAENLCDLFNQEIEPTLEFLPNNIKYLKLGEYYLYSGYKYLAEGEFLREKEKWDDALESYKKSKSENIEGANYILRSGYPQAAALQEMLMNNSQIVSAVYIRQCKRERDLKNEIEERMEDLRRRIKNLEIEKNNLLQSFTDMMKRDVMYNNINEVKTDIMQNMEVVNKIEINFKNRINEFVKHLDDLDIDQKEKDKIKKGADEVQKSEGASFFEKAKKFVQDASKTIKKYGEKAKPILPYLTPLLALL